MLEKGLQAVPLDLGGVGLLSAKLDGRDAPIGRAPGGRLSLLVEGVGRHALVLEMAAPLETTAAQQMLFFRLPRAAAGRLRLAVPGDVEIRSGADVAGRELDRAAGVTRFELLPTAGDATLVMSLNSHLQRQRAGRARPQRAGRRSDRGLREALRHGFAGRYSIGRWITSASSCPRGSRSPRSTRRCCRAGTCKVENGRKIANVRFASRRPRPWC